MNLITILCIKSRLVLGKFDRYTLLFDTNAEILQKNSLVLPFFSKIC